MAKKSTTSDAAAVKPPNADLQRPAAETLYADELARLTAQSAALPRPPGWRLTPRAVLAFILGDEQQGLAPKFVGRRAFLERCIVALATNRGLMLIGEPGTAKSYLSELLAVAISGDSTLTIQGSAGTTEDRIVLRQALRVLIEHLDGLHHEIRSKLVTLGQNGLREFHRPTHVRPLEHVQKKQPGCPGFPGRGG